MKQKNEQVIISPIQDPFKDSLDSVDDTKDKAYISISLSSLFTFTTRGDLKYLIPGIFFSALGALVGPGSAILFGTIFDSFSDLIKHSSKAASYELIVIIREAFMKKLVTYCAIIFGLAGINALIMFGMLSAWFRFSDKQVQRAQTGIFASFIGKSMPWYDTQSGVMGTIALQNRNVQDLRLGTSASLAFTVESIISIITSLCTSFYYSWSLTLVILASFPVIVLITGVFAAPINFHIIQYKDKNEAASKVVDWCIDSISTVKLFNGQKSEIRTFEKIIEKSSKSYIRFINFMSIQQGIVQALVLTMFVQGFWFGSHLVRTGKLSSGSVMSVFWSCMIISESMNSIVPQIMFLQKALVSVSQINMLLNDEHEINKEVTELKTPIEVSGEKQGLTAYPSKCLGDICFKEVSFFYPSRPKTKVLRNISLSVTPNRLTFIVGQSGSGKSSLSNILSGLYETYDGEVQLDSYNIKSLSHKWLLENVTIVQQHSIIFDVSISTNVALGKGHENYKNVTKAQIEEACEFAQLTSTINQFPLGLDTIVSSNVLSGGQRQRLAIARAYIRDTPILVLDEAVSALDFQLKETLLRSIRQWRKDKSTIIITHEMSQIEPNDLVFVMNQGEIVQSGLRCEIENQVGGFFSNMFSLSHQGSSSSRSPESGPSVYYSHSLTSSSTQAFDDKFGYGYDDNDYDFEETQMDGYAGTLTSRIQQARSSSIFYQGAPLPGIVTTDLLSHDHENCQRGDLKRLFACEDKHESDILSIHKAETMISVQHQKIIDNRDRRRLGRRRGLLRINRLRKVSREQDEEMIIGSTERFESKVKHTHLVSLIWKLSKQIPNKPLFFCGLLAAVANGVSSPVFSFVFSKLILGILPIGEGSGVDDIGSRAYLLKWSMIVFGLAIVDGLSTYAKLFLLELSTEKWVKNVREECFRKVISQDVEWFAKLEDQRERDRENRGKGGDMDKSASTITDVIMNETEDMRIIFTRFLSAIINVVSLGTMGVTWSLVVGWKLSLVGISLVPGIMITSKWFASVSEKWEGIYQVCVLNMQALNHEVISGIHTIKVLALETFFLERYEKYIDEANHIAKRKAVMTSIGFGADSIFTLVLQGLLLYYGLKLAVYGEYTYAQMMQVFSLLVFSLMQASQVLQTIPVMSRGKEAALRTEELLSVYSEGEFSDRVNHNFNRAGKVYSRPEFNKGKIDIKDLSFRYSSRPKYQVLDNLSLTINSGESISIVGKSGSGKSTLVSLLAKLYSPNIDTGGRIIINDEHSLIDIDPFWYHEHMSLVTQHPVFFKGTIRENMLYGYRLANGKMALDLSLSDQLSLIRESSNRAGIDDFIMNQLSLCYETILGDDTGGVGGSQISGGQAQRIAIARVILRKPKILILDECTSALDPESSRLVQSTVRDIIKARETTIIIITHKPEMMQLANRVVVLSDGKIAQDGTYNDLITKRNGELYNLIHNGN